SSPALSLYRLTLPPITGMPSAPHASAMPSMADDSSHITRGCSGLPKFRQLTRATGRAPAHATLRQLSATVIAAPARGSTAHHRALPSVDTARARRDGGRPGAFRRSTAASPPGGVTVLR